MTADYCDLTEAYNKIVTECYPAQEAEIKIRCSKYFSEYCKKKKSMMAFGSTEFFSRYFMKWLPNKVCLEKKEIIESFYSSADEYVRLTDMLTGMSEYENFRKIDPKVRYETIRLMMLKRSIMEYNNSFIISKIPCIIDFDKYKLKRYRQENAEHDRGIFAVKSIFSKNSVVLARQGFEHYYIRLFFDDEITELIREGDLFDISIVKKGIEKWKLDDINACYSKDEKDSLWIKN